jgi:hypothetical protein
MTAAPAPLPSLRDLLSSLEALGPRPALVWYGEESRIELSGHVLANWVIKAVGHLDAEVMLERGDLVLLDLPAHWKRLVLALAAWGLGARAVLEEGADDEVRVLATDRPASAARAEDADEVLALDARSLSLRFDGDLPPLVHDWAQEVRSHPDHLAVPLGAWAGPAPSPLPTGVAESPGARLLVTADGLDAPGPLLTALLEGRGIVGPAESVSPEQAQQEDAREA